MSNMQVSLQGENRVASANREEESELTEETTLSEVTKNTATEKMHQKTAKYEAQENTSVVEDNRTSQSEASKMAFQQVTHTVSAGKQVTSTKIETSESFSMEETEEYEIEG